MISHFFIVLLQDNRITTLVTIEEVKAEVTKVVQDFLDAGNYTNFRELMKEIYKDMDTAMQHVRELDTTEELPQGMQFQMYRIWCFIDDAVQSNYKFAEEYASDCQNVRKFFEVFNNILKNC